jgi:hypothetical protein
LKRRQESWRRAGFSESQVRPPAGNDSDLPQNLKNARNPPVKFSIVTPSFRNSNWLKLCIASVADQEGVELEHIVQDACSDDGTQDWLQRDKRVRFDVPKPTTIWWDRL